MGISRHTRKAASCLAIAIAIVATILGAAPAPAAAASDGYPIPVGLTEATGVEHIRANDRVIVTGDDAVEIRNADGDLLQTISNVRGARLPTENKLATSAQGHLAIVYAATTNELVVINTSAGSIEQRIAAGANGVSSIVLIGNDIWYAHGPNQWDAGIGEASIATGVGTPSVWTNSVYAGSQIDVSPSDTSQTFFTRTQLTPSGIRRADSGATQAISGPHENFDPMAIMDDGSAIWALQNDTLAELRPSDLTLTGRAFDTRTTRADKVVLAGDSNASVADSDQIESFTLATGTRIGSATFDSNIIEFDATTTTLFTLLYPRQLVISGLSYEPPAPDVDAACPAVTDSVTRLYSAYFLRAPEPDGWAYWVNNYAGGQHNMDSMSSFFAESPEFQSLYGSVSNDEFVDLVYSNVLGRAPEAEGRQFWSGQLASGAITRGQLMINFSESEEYVGLTDTAIPLAGYFNWYPAGTTFHCGTGGYLFELGRTGDKYLDVHIVNTTRNTQQYTIRSRFYGEWYDDVSTTLTPGAAEFFLGVTVNMEAVMIQSSAEVGWVFLQSPTPLATQRAGWPFLALEAGEAQSSIQAGDHLSLIGS